VTEEAGGFVAHEWYTPEEVARRLRITKRYVYRLITEGKLTAIRVSQRNTRISGGAVMSMLEAMLK
jgi:excisionase family DNA binding protein